MADFQYVEKVMQRRLDAGVTGNALCVMQDGKERYTRYLGATDSAAFGGGKPVSEDTLFRIYSMTKVFAAVSAMILMERGEFVISDEIGDYLPEYRNMDKYVIDFEGTPKRVKAENPIRIEHLLSMTSGIVSGGTSPSCRDFVAAMDEVKKMTDNNPTLGDEVRAMAHVPLAFEPGSHFRYGAGLNVIGYLVEVLSGKTLGQFMKEEIWDPLGMKNTFFTQPKAVLNERLCGIYRERRDGSGIVEKSLDYDRDFEEGMKMQNPSGGMISTLSDVARFADALACGAILKPETLDLMSRNRLCPAALADFRAKAENLAGYGYGLGVRTMMDPSVGSLSPVGEFGWFGMAGSWMMMDPKNKLSAVYMEQIIPSYGWNFPHPKLRNAIYGAL